MSAQIKTSPIILAAGGTGGHIFPAEALAEVLIARAENAVFITDTRYRQYSGGRYQGVLSQLPTRFIHAGTLGGGVFAKLKNAARIGIGTLEALWLLKTMRARAVVGFGGYPSFPTMLAAIILRIPTIIHEQNSVLGRANRALVKHVSRVAITYNQTQYLPASLKSPALWTGNPVRAQVSAVRAVAYPELRADGILRLLVIGGSQGASVFSEIIPAAMALLPEPSRQRVRIDQQCRAGEIEETRARYAALQMQVDIAPFFHDVAARLAGAHLVIARAGASTVAELTAAGRPAILVPYPKATDNHQTHNAQAVEDVGGGWVMAQNGFTAQALAARIEIYLANPDVLRDAASAIGTLGKPEAAEALADLVLQQD